MCDHDGSWNQLQSEPDKFNCTMPMFGSRSYMNIDMGLYLKFDVDAGDVQTGRGQGRPTGCSGLNRPDWIQNKGFREGKYGDQEMSEYDPSNYLDYPSNYKTLYLASTRNSDVVVEDGDVVRFSGCPLNDDVVEKGEKMYKIFEEFANDNQLWVNEFVDVFQKMLENGYQSGNEKGNSQLTESEIPWKAITCSDSQKVCTSGATCWTSCEVS